MTSDLSEEKLAFQRSSRTFFFFFGVGGDFQSFFRPWVVGRGTLFCPSLSLSLLYFLLFLPRFLTLNA